jgi:hypothetical protein
MKASALLCLLTWLMLGSFAPPSAWYDEAAPRLDYGDFGCGPLKTGSCAELALGARAERPARVEPPWSPVRVIVSIPQQKAWVFKNGALIASSPVSTGKRGHATPAGTFRILEKKVTHHSNRYSNAPMPYMQRLTTYGIALHAGHLPGYPASHGCIRLPRSFARKLYGLTDYGTRVTVTSAPLRVPRDVSRRA